MHKNGLIQNDIVILVNTEERTLTSSQINKLAGSPTAEFFSLAKMCRWIGTNRKEESKRHGSRSHRQGYRHQG